MINRVFVAGFISSAIVQTRAAHKEYRFRVYIRGKPENGPADTCYIADVLVCNPRALQFFPGTLQRGDFVILEGELLSRFNKITRNWETLLNAYCVYNLAEFLEANIGDARIRRQDQLSEVYTELLAEQGELENQGLEVF